VISIRPVAESDLEVFYRQQADPEAAAMAVFPSRERDVLIEHWHRNLARPDNVSRTIVVDGVVAGNVVSWEADGRRLVGYWIGREFWGRGVATAAVRAFIEEVTQRPLLAYVATSNIGSIRVLEKNGFVRTTSEPEAGEGGVEEWLFRLDGARD
jgi:RimJ/RimL family protein N-acetyltransferase